jgi:hypothetical protein
MEKFAGRVAGMVASLHEIPPDNRDQGEGKQQAAYSGRYAAAVHHLHSRRYFEVLCMEGKESMTTETRAKRTYPDNSALLDAAEEFLDAIKRNAPEEEIRAIMKKIPIPTEKALSYKKLYGKEFLLEEFNLSEVNAELGEGWLDE